MLAVETVGGKSENKPPNMTLGQDPEGVLNVTMTNYVILVYNHEIVNKCYSKQLHPHFSVRISRVYSLYGIRFCFYSKQIHKQASLYNKTFYFILM